MRLGKGEVSACPRRWCLSVRLDVEGSMFEMEGVRLGLCRTLRQSVILQVVRYCTSSGGIWSVQ